MPKTDNAKYVRRGMDMVIRYDQQWEEDIKESNLGKEGGRFRYADALIM